MKLANSWLEDVPTATPLETFHDEVEELDETDEAEDECEGVLWQQYVVQKPQSSNKMLHELAREVKGEEKRRGKRLGATTYKMIFDNWEHASRRFLRAGHDYFTEFLAEECCKLERPSL